LTINWRNDTGNTYQITLMGKPVAVIASCHWDFLPSSFYLLHHTFDQPKKSERSNIEVPGTKETRATKKVP